MRPRIAFFAALVAFCALVASKFDHRTGFIGLIRFGEPWASRRHRLLDEMPISTAPGSGGYDGQFYAQLALDPLLRDSRELSRVLDAPAYRARRILLPATAAVLGLGRPWWTLQVFACLNVACWFTLAVILAQELVGTNTQQFARWLGCMFGMGVLESVRQSLVDLPAMLLMALAIRTWKNERTYPSVAVMAVSALVKETNLLAAVALFSPIAFRSNWRRFSLLSLSTAILVLGWSVYVQTRFPDGRGELGQGNFAWPTTGILQHVQNCVGALAVRNFDGRYSWGLAAVAALSVQALTLWWNPRHESAWWRVGVAYSVLLLLLGTWVWSGYWAVLRAVLPMTIAFNLLLPSSTRIFWPAWAIGNLPMLHACWRFI